MNMKAQYFSYYFYIDGRIDDFLKSIEVYTWLPVISSKE